MLSYQQVLVITTLGKSLRNTAISWTCEDPHFNPWDEIEDVPAPSFKFAYKTVMHALADGLTLLGPPIKDKHTRCEWWLGRVVQSSAWNSLL